MTSLSDYEKFDIICNAPRRAPLTPPRLKHQQMQLRPSQR